MFLLVYVCICIFKNNCPFGGREYSVWHYVLSSTLAHKCFDFKVKGKLLAPPRGPVGTAGDQQERCPVLVQKLLEGRDLSAWQEVQMKATRRVIEWNMEDWDKSLQKTWDSWYLGCWKQNRGTGKGEQGTEHKKVGQKEAGHKTKLSFFLPNLKP